NRILENDPANKVILTRAGDAHRSLGELSEAEQCYRKALDIGEDLYARLGLAIVARNRDEIAQALDMLETLREQEPDNHRVYVELANTYAQSGNPRDAVKVLSSFNARGKPNQYVEELIDRYRRDG
ncbi:MAG: tetratricopeptide repeat protein, partial [Spirochaetota bacterium]